MHRPFPTSRSFCALRAICGWFLETPSQAQLCIDIVLCDCGFYQPISSWTSIQKPPGETNENPRLERLQEDKAPPLDLYFEHWPVKEEEGETGTALLYPLAEPLRAKSLCRIWNEQNFHRWSHPCSFDTSITEVIILPLIILPKAHGLSSPRMQISIPAKAWWTDFLTTESQNAHTNSH